MPAATYNLTIEQGADFAIQLTLSEDGSAKELAGYSARAQMRLKKTDVSPAASFTCTVTSPSEGKVKMSLTNAITTALSPGIYYYDLELYTANDDNVTRLLQGQATVIAEVTK